MGLLTNKPSSIVVGTSTSVSMNQADIITLISNSNMPTDEISYYLNVSNWKRVMFYYQDQSGAQYSLTVFDPQNGQGKFKTSGKAKKNTWSLIRVLIEDFDNGHLSLSRSGSSGNTTDLMNSEGILAVSPNDPPTSINITSQSLNEKTTFVGNLTVSDPDVGDTHTLEIVNSFGDGNSFSIVGSNALHLKSAANFNLKNSYQVKIKAVDSFNETVEQVFMISVIDVNDTPTDITLSSNTVPENNTSPYTIGTLSATDADLNESFTYSLVPGTGSTDNALFQIEGNTLKLAAITNFESKSSYSVRVMATDFGNLTFSKVFNIYVSNMQEAPTNITLSSSTIAEMSATNTIIGTLTTVDPEGGVFTYSLVGGDTAFFNISGSYLRAAATFDFESKNSYSVTVRATDSTGLYFNKSFAISVTNINETPIDFALSSASINENNAAGATIGTFGSVVDSDVGQSYTFSLVAGTGSTDNASFTITGTSLKASGVLNFESKSSYSIRVRVTDNGSPTTYFDKVFTITVNDINEAPSDISLSSSSILENNAIDAVIGTLSATDSDIGNSFTYSILPGGDADSFSISGSSLKASQVFAYDTKSSYSVTVRATDNTGLTYDKSLTISVSKYYPPAGTWYISGGSLLQSRYGAGGAGAQEAAIAISGAYTTSESTTSSMEKFNGYFWSAAGNSQISSVRALATGTQNAVLYVRNSIVTGFAYTYNGNTHSSLGAASQTRAYGSLAGSMNDALWISGFNSGDLTNSQKWNGTTWATISSSLTQGRQMGAAGGSSTNSILFVGGQYNYASNVANLVNIYNGTVWSAGTALSYRRYDINFSGSPSGGHAFSGYVNYSANGTGASYLDNGTETYNGSTWAAGNPLQQGGLGLGSAGGNNSALAFGGRNGSNINGNTSKYLSNTTSLLPKNMWYTSSAWQLSTVASHRCLTGTESAALAFAGYDFGSSDSGNTYKFNGSSWTTVSNSNYPSTRGRVSGVGTQNSTLSVAGKSFNSGSTGWFGYFNSELFNGTTWSSKNVLNAARYDTAAVGTSSDALVIGGAYGNSGSSPALSYLSSVESYNGASNTWTTSSAALSQQVGGLAAVGTTNSALRMGGTGSGAVVGTVELFNGTTWSAKQGMNVASRYSLAAAGTATDAIGFGGTATALTTERYNGSSNTWTTVCSLSTYTGYPVKGTGTTSSALALNGMQGVEKFFG